MASVSTVKIKSWFYIFCIYFHSFIETSSAWFSWFLRFFLFLDKNNECNSWMDTCWSPVWSSHTASPTHHQAWHLDTLQTFSVIICLITKLWKYNKTLLFFTMKSCHGRVCVVDQEQRSWQVSVPPALWKLLMCLWACSRGHTASTATCTRLCSLQLDYPDGCICIISILIFTVCCIWSHRITWSQAVLKYDTSFKIKLLLLISRNANGWFSLTRIPAAPLRQVSQPWLTSLWGQCGAQQSCLWLNKDVSTTVCESFFSGNQRG